MAHISGNEKFAALLYFSPGSIDDQEVRDRLGRDGEEDLFQLMAQAQLPMPHLNESTTQATVAGLAASRFPPG